MAPTAGEKELIRALQQVDRPLCLECLMAYRDNPAQLCASRPGQARCNHCKDKDVYCLKLNVDASRPVFRTVQRYAAEIVEHRIINDGDVPRRTLRAYHQLVDGAVSFAMAVKEIKELKDERDSVAAANIQTLKKAALCQTKEDAHNWAARCGWELAQMSQQVPKHQYDRQYDGPDIRDLLAELKMHKSKRSETEGKFAKLREQVNTLRLANEELKVANASTAAARDKLAEELKNSRASVLAIEAALERVSLERASRKEFAAVVGTTPGGRGDGGRGDGRVATDAEATRDYKADEMIPEKQVELRGRVASEDATPAAMPIEKRPRAHFDMIPERIKCRIFQLVLGQFPSIQHAYKDRFQQMRWLTLKMDARDKTTIRNLLHTGKAISTEHTAPLNMYISMNRCRIDVPGVVNKFTRQDHAALLNLCLVSKEWMVRAIRAQVLAYERLAGVQLVKDIRVKRAPSEEDENESALVGIPAKRRRHTSTRTR